MKKNYTFIDIIFKNYNMKNFWPSDNTPDPQVFFNGIFWDKKIACHIFLSFVEGELTKILRDCQRTNIIFLTHIDIES
jgi:hypothetical protein